MPLAGIASVHPVTLKTRSSRWTPDCWHSDHRLNRCLAVGWTGHSQHSTSRWPSSLLLTSLHRCHTPVGRRIIRCWRIFLWALDIVSGTWYAQCTDAPFWTVGSSGAYKLTGFDSFLHQIPWRRIFRQPSDAPMTVASVLPVIGKCLCFDPLDLVSFGFLHGLFNPCPFGLRGGPSGLTSPIYFIPEI